MNTEASIIERTAIQIAIDAALVVRLASGVCERREIS